MLEIRSDPPADATTALELGRIAREILTFTEGTAGMYAPALVREADTLVGDAGADALLVELEPVDPTLDATFVALGFDCTRELLQLRRTLPLAPDAPAVAIETRPFQVGQDEPAWLEVNNRAFDWHPEQGGWTLADVEEREAEPWFDADGFLLHERAGALVGFCWTKIHPPAGDEPALGEIYVIASDPAVHGRGLGTQLTVAGLTWLHRAGVDTAMLYVESDNFAARHVYEDTLGFHVHQTHRWYRRPVG